jgi:hypothetical protein
LALHALAEQIKRFKAKINQVKSVKPDLAIE